MDFSCALFMLLTLSAGFIFVFMSLFIHESSHLAVLRLLGGDGHITYNLSGGETIIDEGILNSSNRWLVTAAGGAVSGIFMLAVWSICHFRLHGMPRLAIAPIALLIAVGELAYAASLENLPPLLGIGIIPLGIVYLRHYAGFFKEVTKRETKGPRC